MNDPSFAETEELFSLFSTCTSILCSGVSADEFLDRIATIGPILAPSFVGRVSSVDKDNRRVFRLLGWHIYNQTPLPQHNYACDTQPAPGRNSPCLCGSGRKYKQCCLGFEDEIPFADYNLLRHVLDCLPKKSLAELPGSQVDVLAVVDAAMQWLEEDQDKRVLALLEPWFKAGVKMGRNHIPIFSLLMDLYYQRGNTVKRSRLLAQVLAAENKYLRSAGMQRKALILSDKQDIKGAWECFVTAQRLTPDDPMVAVLEITLLSASQEYKQVQDRARFWLMRFRNDRSITPEVLQLLEAFAENPQGTFNDLALGGNPELARLSNAFYDAGAPQVLYQIEDWDGQGCLMEHDTLAAAEQEWHSLFGSSKPMITYVYNDATEVWHNAELWLACLERNPLLWQSFDVLDDLAMAVDALDMHEVIENLLEPLLDRAVMLLDSVIGTLNWQAPIPWIIEHNRPALRCLAHRTFAYLEDDPTGDNFIVLAQRMLAINPNDNHGFREPLSLALIAKRKLQEMQDLAACYPDDLSPLAINSVLAAYLLGEKGKALSLLLSCGKQQKETIKMLLATSPRKPKINAEGYVVGGREQAWLYRQNALPLWQRDGALEWLETAWNSVKRKC